MPSCLLAPPINITSITLYIKHTIMKITILWVGRD